jgi:P27 family predicted phage terminase small subunit
MPQPAKSLELCKLQGTRSQVVKTPAVGDSHVVGGRPVCPRSLSKEARQIFKKLCRQLEERHALTRGDCELLRLYATSWDRQRQADAALQEEGLVVTYTRLNANGREIEVEKSNLNLAIAERAENQMVSILDRLGLTPFNREKVKPAKHAEPGKPELIPGTMAWFDQRDREKAK